VQAAYDAASKAGWTTFYARDRGEDGVEATKFANFAEYSDNHQYEEYAYILRTDGKWYVAEEVGKFIELTEAFEKEEA